MYRAYIEPSGPYWPWAVGIVDPDGVRYASSFHSWFWRAQRKYAKRQRQAAALNAEVGA